MGQTKSTTNKTPKNEAVTITQTNTIFSTPNSNGSKLPCSNDTPVLPLPNQEQINRLTPRDKSLKSRSINSLSKAFRNGRWKTKRRGSISASFSVADCDIKVELMNVNSATEDELMTLPGVNRTLAKNIINHRLIIGGFRKVEDLALVSGMGATKLDLIRPEICVTKRRNLSRASSKTPSMDSLPSSNDSNRYFRAQKPLVNVNTGTIFDLMGVNGINQSLASKIITYRDRKGPLKQLDDLKNVGISYRMIGALRHYLTVDSTTNTDSDGFDSVLDDKASIKSNPTNSNSPATPHHPHTNLIKENIRSNSVSSTTALSKEKGSSFKVSVEAEDEVLDDEDVFRKVNKNDESFTSKVDDMTAIYELMSLKTSRPIPSQNFQFDNHSVYRLGSWNLERLSNEKISNLGVLEVITRTILENGLSILAVQDVCDKAALRKICDELNMPKLPRNREWRKPIGKWDYVLNQHSPVHYDKTPHYLGIIYNKEEIDEISIPETFESFPPHQNGSLWQFGVFNVKASNSSWIIVNVFSTSLNGPSGISYLNGHATNGPDGNVSEMIDTLIKSFGGNGVIILGHFNPNSSKGLGNLQNIERISLTEQENNEEDTFSSVWMSPGIKEFYTGDHGFVTGGLSHLAIPNGWAWGGRATQSSPFWINIYKTKPTKQNNNKLELIEVVAAGKVILNEISPISLRN